MTNEEIRNTIERMNMSRKHKDALLSQCLAGNPSARFAVYASRMKQEGRQYGPRFSAWLAS